MNNQCDEIERQQNIDTRVICDKIKGITGTKERGVKQRWEEYTYELFNGDREPFEVADDTRWP